MSGLSLNYTNQAASNPYALAKFGTADGTVVPAAAPSDEIIGVFDELAHAVGDSADVQRYGYCLIQLGGTVTRGDWLTTNATGQAVTAAPAAGSNVSVIGRAEVSGVAGDIVQHVLAIGQIQG